MTNEQLIILGEKLDLLSNLKGVKFAYAIARNRRIIKAHAEDMRASIAQSCEYAEYESKRKELCLCYCEKVNGEPKISSGQYVIIDGKLTEFEKESLALCDEYKDALESHKKTILEFEKLLKEKSNIELFKISDSDIPQEISVSQMELIVDLIAQ